MRSFYRVIQIVTFCGLLLGLSACQTVEPPPPIELLERPQRADDIMPANLLSKFDPDSARLIDKRNSRTYWAARNESGEICLIVGFNIGRPDFISGAGCAAEEQVHLQGITVAIKSGNHFTSAIFVPDGYTNSLVSTFPGNFVATNLVGFDSLNSLEQAIGSVSQVTVVPDDDPDLDELTVNIVR